ncbi:unnamed protein product [Moneuplotes crassus]|uniref:Uncharacterized protein n=1 Tax=Euplotes crassus TaxID=5936 RepID=A0AAD1Y5V2_EUPCR|nr:unnamed protein product [Moneuplotes crassus]
MKVRVIFLYMFGLSYLSNFGGCLAKLYVSKSFSIQKDPYLLLGNTSLCHSDPL